MIRTFAVPLVLVFTALGCGGDDGEPAFFPADYADTYREVRDCRFSIEHDLVRIRIVASPEAAPFYLDRSAPLPVGSIVVKEEYDDGDDECQGPIERYSVMRRLDTGSAPDALDYDWQEVAASMREEKPTDPRNCISCHTNCGHAPEGHDGTCAVP